MFFGAFSEVNSVTHHHNDYISSLRSNRCCIRILNNKINELDVWCNINDTVDIWNSGSIVDQVILYSK